MTAGRAASTTRRAPRGRGSRSSPRGTGTREGRDSSCPGKREEIERIIATTNPAELVRRIHAVQDRLEALAAPHTARLARRVSPDMAYLNKTLARIAGVEPEEGEPPQADEDQDFALTTGEAPLWASRSFSNEAPRSYIGVPYTK